MYDGQISYTYEIIINKYTYHSLKKNPCYQNDTYFYPKHISVLRLLLSIVVNESKVLCSLQTLHYYLYASILVIKCLQ